MGGASRSGDFVACPGAPCPGRFRAQIFYLTAHRCYKDYKLFRTPLKRSGGNKAVHLSTPRLTLKVRACGKSIKGTTALAISPKSMLSDRQHIQKAQAARSSAFEVEAGPTNDLRNALLLTCAGSSVRLR